MEAAGTEADAGTEEPRKSNKKAKKAKVKKDKWGLPLLVPVDDAEHAREDEQFQWNVEEKAVVPEEGTVSHELTKVVVSGMPYSATEKQIRDLFKDIGPISQLQLSRFPDSGNFRGLAFVTFQEEETATNALELDGTKMGNRYIKVERCRIYSQRKRKFGFHDEPKKVDGCLSAYVGNLSWELTEDDIRDYFKDSKISSVRLALDKTTGVSRGFCHIDFEDDESLEEAMKKNQLEFHGRAVKIAYAISNRN